MSRRRTLAISFGLLLLLCTATIALWISYEQKPHYVTEQDARLISLARTAVVEAGFSLSDAIYEVRRDGDGWIVEINKSPGYRGTGEPSVVVDATVFVKFNSAGAVTRILSQRFNRSTIPATQPVEVR